RGCSYLLARCRVLLLAGRHAPHAAPPLDPRVSSHLSGAGTSPLVVCHVRVGTGCGAMHSENTEDAARSSFMRQAHPPFWADPNPLTCDWIGGRAADE